MLSPTVGVHVELGGDVRILGDRHVGSPRAPVRGGVARRVLAVLALEQRPVARDELGDAVWGEELPRTWETALRGAVHQIRKAVSEVAPDAPELIRTAFGCYQLDPDASVDLLAAAAEVDEAERLLSAGDAVAAAEEAGRAVPILAAPLLTGLDGEWLDAARRRLQGLRFRALHVLSAASTACGQHARAVEAAEHAVALDPYQEQAHRQLMAAHAAGGDRGAALLAYRRCRDLLEQDLGVAPSDQTEAVLASLAVDDAQPVTPVVLPSTLDTTFALAGRAAELAALRAAWGASSTGTTVVVVGPAGTGKSRLVAELAALAFAGGAAVAHGRFDPDDLGALSALGGVLGQLGVAWPPPGVPLDRAVLLDAARTALRRAAAGRGLVVVLDDVHWADRPSLALLADLAAEPIPGLLLAATARDDWVPPALAELLEHVVRVDLEPLDAAGTGDLIAAWAGHRATEGAIDAIHRRTGGNPYFVTAVLQDLADRGAVDLAAGIAVVDEVDLLESVPQLVAAAVDRCGPDAATVALRAAVLGDEFRADVLAEVVGRPSGAVAATLERLAHVRVLGRRPDDGNRFRFVHALVRRSLLDGAADDALRAGHQAAAAVLAERSPGTPEVLGHLLAARDAASLEPAVELGIALAASLVDAGAPDEAVDILEALLAWLDEAGGTDALRAAVLMGLADAQVSRDRLEEGRHALRSAAELAVAAGDPAILRTGVLLLRPPSATEHDPVAVEAASGLLALADPGSELEVAAGCWLAAEVGATDPERSAAIAADALEQARRLGQPDLHRLAGFTWHLMARAMSPPSTRRALMEEVLRLPRSSRSTEATGHVFLAGDCLELGDRPAAARSVAAALDATDGYGKTHVRWISLRNRVLLTVLDGDLERAEAEQAAADEVAAALPIPEAVVLPVMQRVLTNFHQGRLDELHPLVAAFSATAPLDGPVPIVHAWMSAHLGAADTEAAAERAVASAAVIPRTAAWVGVRCLAVEVAAMVGHPATAELAAPLEASSGQHAVIVTIGYLGAIDRYLALAARAAGEDERAAALFERAQAQHEAVGARCYLERTERERAEDDPAA